MLKINGSVIFCLSALRFSFENAESNVKIKPVFADSRFHSVLEYKTSVNLVLWVPYPYPYLQLITQPKSKQQVLHQTRPELTEQIDYHTNTCYQYARARTHVVP